MLPLETVIQIPVVKVSNEEFEVIWNQIPPRLRYVREDDTVLVRIDCKGYREELARRKAEG